METIDPNLLGTQYVDQGQTNKRWHISICFILRAFIIFPMILSWTLGPKNIKRAPCFHIPFLLNRQFVLYCPVSIMSRMVDQSFNTVRCSKTIMMQPKKTLYLPILGQVRGLVLLCIEPHLSIHLSSPSLNYFLSYCAISEQKTVNQQSASYTELYSKVLQNGAHMVL